MIREYFGLLGAGKTFNMTYDAMWWISKGLRVVTNYKVAYCSKKKPLNTTDHVMDTRMCKYGGDHCWSNFYNDPEEYLWHVVHDQHTLFAIDEASIIFPPRVNLPRSFLHKFLQSRKDTCHLYYTAQVPKYVYPMLRALTNQTVRCNTRPALGMFHKLPYIHFKEGRLVYEKIDSMEFVARWYDTSIIERRMNFYDRKGRDRAWRTRVIYPSDARPVFHAYDTMFKVDYSAGFKTRKFGQSNNQVIQTNPKNRVLVENSNVDLIARAEAALKEAQAEVSKSEFSLKN